MACQGDYSLIGRGVISLAPLLRTKPFVKVIDFPITSMDRPGELVGHGELCCLSVLCWVVCCGVLCYVVVSLGWARLCCVVLCCVVFWLCYVLRSPTFSSPTFNAAIS